MHGNVTVFHYKIKKSDLGLVSAPVPWSITAVRRCIRNTSPKCIWKRWIILTGAEWKVAFLSSYCATNFCHIDWFSTNHHCALVHPRYVGLTRWAWFSTERFKVITGKKKASIRFWSITNITFFKPHPIMNNIIGETDWCPQISTLSRVVLSAKKEDEANGVERTLFRYYTQYVMHGYVTVFHTTTCLIEGLLAHLQSWH